MKSMLTNKLDKRIKDLSLVISIFNEEESLKETVEELIKKLKNAKIKFEIYLVNNGSLDKSQEIINSLKKKYPSLIKVIIFKKNKKLGGAVNYTTKKHLKGNVIGFTCADGEVSASDTVKILKEILNNREISLVKTVRKNRLDGMRVYVSKGYNFLVKALFGIDTKDINGWPVLIKYEDFKNMNLRDYSWIFQLEYLYQTKRMGKKMVEIDVMHQRRKGGKSKVKIDDIIIFFCQMMSYRLRTLFWR